MYSNCLWVYMLFSVISSFFSFSCTPSFTKSISLSYFSSISLSLSPCLLFYSLFFLALFATSQHLSFASFFSAALFCLYLIPSPLRLPSLSALSSPSTLRPPPHITHTLHPSTHYLHITPFLLDSFFHSFVLYSSIFLFVVIILHPSRHKCRNQGFLHRPVSSACPPFFIALNCVKRSSSGFRSLPSQKS